MKFNDAYSQMFPGYPDAISLQQAAEMLGLNRHTVGELIRSSEANSSLLFGSQ